MKEKKKKRLKQHEKKKKTPYNINPDLNFLLQ